MFKPIAVRALPNYKLWLRYSNGTEGEVDVSDYAGKGVFKAWDDYTFFEAVNIPESGAVAWGDDLDLCPDALYLRLTGQTPENVFPNLKQMNVDA